MYSGHKQAIEGIGKNTFEFLGKNSVLIFFLMLVVFFILFLPFPLLIFDVIESSPWTLHILTVVTLYSLTWIFAFLGFKIKWFYGFLWPVMYLNLIYMAALSWYRTVSGKGFIWKERKVD